MAAVELLARGLTHHIVEGENENAHAAVNGVARQITLGSAPVTVFDKEARIGGQGEIARFAFDRFPAALLEQRYEWASRAPQLKAH